MKNLFRLLMVLVMLVITVQVDAQTYKVKGGLNITGINSIDNEGVTIRPGFHVGVTADIPLKSMFSIEAGLLLTTKGYKEEANIIVSEYDLVSPPPVEEFVQKSEFLVYYLEIPVTLKASFDIGEAKVYGALGSYVAYGIRENSDLNNYYNGEVHSSIYNYTKGRNGLARFDYGLVFGLGLEYRSVLLGLSYDLGLRMFPDSYSSVSIRTLGISVGYIING